MDKVIKAICLNSQVKVCIVNGVDITNEAIRRHDVWPSASSVLGKTMVIGLMMASSLKGEEAITIKIDGSGPIGCVVVDVTSNNTVRGYVSSPHVNFTNALGLDEITTLGTNGFIDVIKDLKLNNLHSSTTEIQTGNLAYDFAYYYNTSEQVQTAIMLGSTYDVSNVCTGMGGILIQLLPGASDEVITYLEEKINEVNNYSKLLNLNEEEILKIFFEDDFEILDIKEASFKCPCSKEKFLGGLLTLSKEDLIELIEVEKKASVTCSYCNNHYEYTPLELEEVLKRKNN